MPSGKSQCNTGSAQQAPPIMWSQRTLRTPDIIVKGEGLYLDSSQNKSTPLPPTTTSISLGTTAAPVGSGGPTRSFLQTKIGAKMIKGNQEQKQQQKQSQQLEISGKSISRDQNASHDEKDEKEVKGPQPVSSASGGTSSWTWDSGSDPVLLEPYVEKKDLDLFQQCREHLDAINQSTQLQQVINDEMRSQAELDQKLYELLRAKAQRLAKQTTMGDADWDHTWINTAFSDLRKSVKEQAHAHSAYSQTLLSQSTVIQQSLDSHKKLMEKTKRGECPPDMDCNWRGSTRPSACMSFVQATCEFDLLHRPRLKLISELEFLNTQVKSLDQQLQDIEWGLSSIKESEEAEKAQWRLQHKLEEARTRQDFLRTRRKQLQCELNEVGCKLKEFHLQQRDKMTVLVNVFTQHRARCDSTLRKSISLLRAAFQNDREVLKTLDARKRRQLSPTGQTTTPNLTTDDSLTEIINLTLSDNILQHPLPTTSETDKTVNLKTGEFTSGAGAGSSNNKSGGEDGVLKRQQMQDRNPLKFKRVSFEETHVEDKEFRQDSSWAENDSTANRSTADDDSDTESPDLTSSNNRPEGKMETKHEGSSVSIVKSSSLQRNSPSKKKESYFTFLSLDDCQSPTESTQSNKDKRMDSQIVGGSNQIFKPNCVRKTRLGAGDVSMKTTKVVGKSESFVKTKETTSVQNMARDVASTAPKNDRSPLIHSESKTILTLPKDKKITLEESNKRNEKRKSMTPVRPDTAPVSGVKSKDSKVSISNKPQANFKATGEYPRAKPISTAIIFSNESKSKNSPVKFLPQGSPVSRTSDHTDNSASGQTRPNLDSNEAASGSDSDSSDKKMSMRGTRKASVVDKSRNKVDKFKQSSGDRAEQNSPVLQVHGKPPPAITKVTAYKPMPRETSASSDMGRRRVAFSDLDVTSQVSEGRSRCSSASGSRTQGSGQDRGILKKPSDSNSFVKSVIVREENEAKTRIRLDDRSQGGDMSGMPASHSGAVCSKINHALLDRASQYDKDPRLAREVLVRSNDAFIPDISESSQSHSSISSSESYSSAFDETGGKDGEDPWVAEKVKQLKLENLQLQNFELEQKRMRDEEDRMNRLISKYANNRRGLGGVSMNYNNSETTMLPCGEVSLKERLPSVAEEIVTEVGRAERLEFDADTNKQDDDSCRIGSSHIVDPSKQPKVCTVRSIPSDASDFNQNENPVVSQTRSRCELTDQNHESTPHGENEQYSISALGGLRKLETTSGQFTMRSYEGESNEYYSMSVERHEGPSNSPRQHSRQKGRSSAEIMKCEWSAQKYNTSQTDLNNNLSSACDNMVCDILTVTDQHSVQLLGSSSHFDAPRTKMASKSCPRHESLESGHLEVHTELPDGESFLQVRQDQSLEHSSRNEPPSTKLLYTNLACTKDHTHSTDMVTTSSKDTNRRCLTSSYKAETKHRPLLRETGFECYTAEEKVDLPDPRLLCQDFNDNKLECTTEYYKRPLKSCLKRRIFDKGSHQPELSFSTEVTKTHANYADRDLEIRDNSTYKQSVSEPFFPSRECHTLLHRQNALRDFPHENNCSLVKTKTQNKSQKRVQFKETIHCCYAHEDCSIMRRSQTVDNVQVNQLDDCDLNLSNNSSSDSLCYPSSHSMASLSRSNWMLVSIPLTGTILVSLSNQCRVWDFFRARPQRKSTDKRLWERDDIIMTRTSRRNRSFRKFSYFCMLSLQKDSLLAILVVP